MEIELFVITFYPEITWTSRTNTIFNNVRFTLLRALTSHWYWNLRNVIDSGLSTIIGSPRSQNPNRRKKQWLRNLFLALMHFCNCCCAYSEFSCPNSRFPFGDGRLLFIWPLHLQAHLSWSSFWLLTGVQVLSFSLCFISLVNVSLILYSTSFQCRFLSIALFKHLCPESKCHS